MSAPRVPGGKAQHRNADHALEHQRVALAHLVGRLADRHGAGDVGRAVLILGAGIEQEQARLSLSGRLVARRHAVMHDRAVRAGAGDRVEKETSRSGICVSSPVDAAHLLELASRRRSRRACPGSCASSQQSSLATAAPSRRWAARAPAISAPFLVARGRRAGSAAVDDRAAVLDSTSMRSLSAASTGSSAMRRAVLRERGDRRLERGRRPQIGELRQIGLRLHRQLALVDEKRDAMPSAASTAKAERQRRVRHVGAADVEGPGDRRRVGQHGMRRAALARSSPPAAPACPWPVRRRIRSDGSRPAPAAASGWSSQIASIGIRRPAAPARRRSRRPPPSAP